LTAGYTKVIFDMTVQSIAEPGPTFRELAFGSGTPRKAVMTAMVVGTVLAAINHGDVFLSGELPSLWKVCLTYCVPYCVTTWGAITGKRAQWRTQSNGR
jgi:hypothetical protein